MRITTLVQIAQEKDCAIVSYQDVKDIFILGAIFGMLLIAILITIGNAI